MSEESVSWETFYEAVGRGVTAWGLVENALTDLFSRLVICAIRGSILGVGFDQIWIVSNVLNSISNFGARLQIVEDTFTRLITDEALRAEWKTVKNKLNDKYKWRVMLAHGAVAGNEAGASFIAAPMFSSKDAYYTYDQVADWPASFKSLEHRVTELAITANKHLADKWKAVQSG